MESNLNPLDASLDRPTKVETNASDESETWPQECFSPFQDSLLRETTTTPINIPEMFTSEESCGVESVHALSDAESLMEQFPKYVEDILTGDPNEQYFAAYYFHQLLSVEGCPYIQEVIDAGVVPCCVRFLGMDDQQVGGSSRSV